MCPDLSAVQLVSVRGSLQRRRSISGMAATPTTRVEIDTDLLDRLRKRRLKWVVVPQLEDALAPQSPGL